MGTLQPQRLYIFNPRFLKTQTTIAMNNFLITVVHISFLIKIDDKLLKFYFFSQNINPPLERWKY